MTIKNVKDSEIPEILERLKDIPHASFSISYRNPAQVIEKRLQLIMELVDEVSRKGKEHSLETYYRISRIRGYKMKRKTFTRDIALLEKMGKICRKVNVGGSSGTTSIITKASP